jgi:hypothetical protein
MDSEGRRDGAVDGLTAIEGSSTVMDGAARRQWTARRLLDGDGWRDGSLMAMYGSATAMECDRNGDNG